MTNFGLTFDSHSNFAYSTVATAPSPADTGNSLVISSGDGSLFPDAPFNCTVWATGANPRSTNAEIIRVLAKVGDTFTIQRAQESTTARTILAGDNIALTITAKSVSDLESALQSNAELESRIETLETKLNSIINLLEEHFVVPPTLKDKL